MSGPLRTSLIGCTSCCALSRCWYRGCNSASNASGCPGEVVMLRKLRSKNRDIIVAGLLTRWRARRTTTAAPALALFGAAFSLTCGNRILNGGGAATGGVAGVVGASGTGGGAGAGATGGIDGVTGTGGMAGAAGVGAVAGTGETSGTGGHGGGAGTIGGGGGVAVEVRLGAAAGQAGPFPLAVTTIASDRRPVSTQWSPRGRTRRFHAANGRVVPAFRDQRPAGRDAAPPAVE